MARDDYFVIVYQILSYLYQCLKKGKEPDPSALSYGSMMLQINKKYWIYIIKTLLEEGYIRGAAVSYVDNETDIVGLNLMEITPAGIEYLNENSLFEKAKKYIEKGLELVPFNLIDKIVK